MRKLKFCKSYINALARSQQHPTQLTNQGSLLARTLSLNLLAFSYSKAGLKLALITSFLACGIIISCLGFPGLRLPVSIWKNLFAGIDRKIVGLLILFFDERSVCGEKGGPIFHKQSLKSLLYRAVLWNRAIAEVSNYSLTLKIACANLIKAVYVDMELGASIRDLAAVINPPSDSESDDDQPSSYYAKLGPGNIGLEKETAGDNQVGKGTMLAEKMKNTKDIWDTEEVNEGAEYDDEWDTRASPEYDIVYKQAVGSEDVFLGMNNKTPATASCEDMLIKVMLPDTKFKDVTVDLTDKFLSVRSSKFKLGLHLPHPCDSKNGKAQWISDKETLHITVRMKRDYDFINF